MGKSTAESADGGPGEIARRVDVAVSRLRDDPGLDEVGEARAAVAANLARVLDSGAGMATAAVARELRAVLSELHPGGDDGDSDALDALAARLSAPVRDSAAD